jgi:hypothetical protein
MLYWRKKREGLTMASLAAVIIRCVLEAIKLLCILIKGVFQILKAIGLLIPALITIAYFFGIITYLESKYSPMFRAAHMRQIWISVAVVFAVTSILRFTLKPAITKVKTIREEKELKSLVKRLLILFREHGLDVNTSGYVLEADGMFVYKDTGSLFLTDMRNADEKQAAQNFIVNAEPAVTDDIYA